MMPAVLAGVLLVTGSVISGPEALEDSLNRLKEAESKQDAALVKKLAVETCALARKVASEPAPEGEAEKDVWQKQVSYARDVEAYTEYALYAGAVKGAPAVTVDLLSTLEHQNPKSKYLENVYGRYILALTQTGASAKIPAIADAALTHFPNNEDLLMVSANSAMARKQTDRASRLAERLITVLGNHPMPVGMSAADWQKKKAAALGRAYWIAGMMHSEKTQYFEADKDLRAALPIISGDELMKANALFHLGVANYQLGSATRNRAQVLEGAKFSEQAAVIKGPLSYQAWRNAQLMKTEAAKLR